MRISINMFDKIKYIVSINYIDKEEKIIESAYITNINNYDRIKSNVKTISIAMIDLTT